MYKPEDKDNLST